VRFHIEQAELEYREQTAGPRTDDQYVSLDDLAHTLSPNFNDVAALIWEDAPRLLGADTHDRYACRSGVRTTKPSSSAVTLIWHDNRESGFTS
jgi:hypothetical protein